MEFRFTDEQRMIRDTAEAFLSAASDSAAVRGAMASERGYDAALWKQICDELYWPAIHVPEDYGGLGLGYVELAATMEQMGRYLFCGPYFSSVCLAINALLLAGSEAQKATWLPRIVAGDTATLVGGVDTPLSWEATEQGYRLQGGCRYVIDGHSADWLVVAARQQGGDAIGLFMVPGNADGLHREWLPTMDQTRKQAQLDFGNVQLAAADRLGGEVDAGAALAATLDLAAIALAAEQVGGAQQCLDSTLAYIGERVQFGRSIASFQAVKHKAADMMVKVEAARSASYYAACIAEEFLTGGPMGEELAEAASVAKAWCSDAYLFNAGCGIQLHGGVGFTWEYDIQLYFKRAKSSEVLLGNASFHRERLAAQLLD